MGLGRIEGDLDRRSQSKRTLERALTLFEQVDDRSGYAQALIAYGLTLSVLGDLLAEARRGPRRPQRVQQRARTDDR